ncbi:MAG: trypsin-like serine protease [Ruminococcaceae bacterium]|nr:trypsin-like serine protease [Oscillospiraceae bacterium]
MKKFNATVLVFVLFIMVTVVPVSANEISVYINQNKLDFDVSPQLISDRTFVPMRKIFESLGATVTWDDDTKTVTGKKGDITINLTIDSKTMFKNGNPKLLDVAPTLVESRTLVPVRAIAESFDCEVTWDNNTQSVYIKAKNDTTASVGNDTNNYNSRVLSASEISEKVSPSVFYIEVYDHSGTATGSGSGFFISSNGVAVTNYHVIEDTSSATITTTDGNKYNVDSIIAYDKDLDVAIIRVNQNTVNGSNFSNFQSVNMANSDDIQAGQTIYAIGSPLGLQNTISNGIISNVSQKLGDEIFIQITAPISHGSSGGALVNELGEVIGITSAGIVEAQNIGFAIPINMIKLFDLNAPGVSYEEYASYNNSFTIEVYPETIDLEVGETKEIYVYADGNADDWSIYWYADRAGSVSCVWGDWFEDNTSICTLKVTAEKAGNTVITIYSDVDFKGKDILVNIKRPSVVTYSGTNIPTYTAITGTQSCDYKEYENTYCYSYNYWDINTVQSYVDYLLSNGFEFYKDEEQDFGTNYYYYTPSNDLLLICLAWKYKQVWIYIPR